MWHMSGRLRQEDYEVSRSNRMGFCHRKTMNKDVRRLKMELVHLAWLCMPVIQN